MDEDYARKLRNWLRAEPGATHGGASEEREWLREIPEPATEEPAGNPDRWSVRGRLPQTPADDAWVCPVIALPIPRSSGENGCRMSGAEVRVRWDRPANAARRAAAPDTGPGNDAEVRSGRGRHAAAPDAGPGTDAEVRRRPSRRAEADRRDETPGAAPMTEAEARSRWNHPANWHRRRRAAEDRRRDQSGDR